MFVDLWHRQECKRCSGEGERLECFFRGSEYILYVLGALQSTEVWGKVCMDGKPGAEAECGREGMWAEKHSADGEDVFHY